jgi:hypothetical protein
MVIDLNDESLFALKAKINGAMQSGNLSTAWKTLEVLNKTYPEDPEIDYYEYRKSIYEYNIDKAIVHTNKLQKFIDKSDSKYYLNSSDIWNLKQQLPYWRNILEIKSQNKALRINVRTYPTVDENGYVNEEYSIVMNPNINLDIAPYEIKPKSSFTIEVENNSQITQYLYCVYFDFNGSFEIVPLFDDYNVVDSGLPKDSKIESYIFVQDGAIGLENICIYSSPKRIREFERPMNTNARGASRPLEKFTNFEIMKNDVFLLFK